MSKQSQSQARGSQSQSQSASQHETSARQESSGPSSTTRSRVPGDNPGTLNDFDLLPTGGPDALDAVTTDSDAGTTDSHPDSRPDHRRDQQEDPERAGGSEDRSQLL